MLFIWRIRIILIFTIFANINACVYVPTPEYGDAITGKTITDNDIENLKAETGVITRSDVIRKHGMPDKRSIVDAHFCYNWSRMKGIYVVGAGYQGDAGAGRQVHWLCLLFDSKGILINVEHIEPFLSIGAAQKRKELLNEWYRNDPDKVFRMEEVHHSDRYSSESLKLGLIKEANTYCYNADNGHKSAQYRIAQLHEYGGYGKRIDKVRAWVWYSLSARNGDSRSAQSVARLDKSLSSGELEDARKMLAEWRKGQCTNELLQDTEIKTSKEIKKQTIYSMALKGYPESQWRLYAEYGKKPEDASWLCRSANAGYAKAQLHIGQYYWNSPNLIHNKAKAYVWYRLAATGDKLQGLLPEERTQQQAATAMKDAEKALSAEELALARELYEKWSTRQCELEIYL